MAVCLAFWVEVLAVVRDSARAATDRSGTNVLRCAEVAAVDAFPELPDPGLVTLAFA